MSRIDVKKFTFVGINEQKEEFFHRAQQKGMIHFIDVSQKKASHTPQEIQDLTSAIKILRSLPVANQVEPSSVSRALPIAKEVLALRHAIDSKEEKLRVLVLEIERIREFGNFSLDDIAYIEKEGNRIIQFYCAKKGHFEEKDLPENVMFINSDHGLDYYVGINETRRSFSKMVEMVFEYSLSELMDQAKGVREDIRKSETALKELAKYNDFLHKALIVAHNHYTFDTNLDYARDELNGSLFVVEGWIPMDRMDDIKDLVGELGIYFEEVLIEETDSIPTCLENRGAGKIGEDLINIYDTPHHTDKDPSLWVLSAFALFFAMIVNDAGYGLVFLVLAIFIKYKFWSQKGVGKRVINLTLILCAGCIVWGTLTTSFFGINISMDSPLRNVSLLGWISEKKAEFHLHFKDSQYEDWKKNYPEISGITDGKEFFQTTEITENGFVSNKVLSDIGRKVLLELALLVGIIHIALSFARYLGRNWSGIGWIAVLVGGYLYFPHYLEETTLLYYVFGVPRGFGATEGLQLMYIGIAAAVGLAVLQHRLAGLVEPMNLIQVFADVLSYLRLYALGLASAIVSETINEIYGTLPFLLAIVIIALAHVVNMLLGIMGGVIHGLRLNFIEWYHYSFEGGGKAFDPLRLYEVE